MTIEEVTEKLMATATETIEARRKGEALFDERSAREDAARAQDDSGERADLTERIVDYVADPETVESNRRLTGALGVCVVIILVQATFNLTLYLRRPDRIVVDRTAGGDRVVVMNNREYGLTDNVGFSPDEPTAGDKKYIVSRFLELYYGNNPDIRDRQLNEAIQLMVASRGRELFEYLRRNRVLEQQAAESWQARWTEQQIWVDQSDPFTVHVIGTQNLTRVVNQRPTEETHQLNLTVKVARDELGRDDRNRRSGYQITWFGWEELQNAQGASGNSQLNQTAVAPAATTQSPATR
jgi:hypothetical protein